MRLSGTEKRKTTNTLYLTNRQGLPIIMSSPESGEHNDIYHIENVIESMFDDHDLDRSSISIDGLFLNTDAGFDCDLLRHCLDRNGVIANICISKRRTETDSIYIDDELYAECYSVERINVWMDSYRTILNRFDTTVSIWESWNYLAFAVILLKKISRNRKV